LVETDRGIWYTGVAAVLLLRNVLNLVCYIRIDYFSYDGFTGFIPIRIINHASEGVLLTSVICKEINFRICTRCSDYILLAHYAIYR